LSSCINSWVFEGFYFFWLLKLRWHTGEKLLLLRPIPVRMILQMMIWVQYLNDNGDEWVLQLILGWDFQINSNKDRFYFILIFPFLFL
jgi:hypothetical protein